MIFIKSNIFKLIFDNILLIMENTRLSFINRQKYSYKINGSEFITYVFPINFETEINQFIKEVEVENKKAVHVVWGYCFWKEQDFIYKYFDSTEPKKSAGFKIDYFIRNKNLCNCLIVIARYKSGPNLGIGLLSRSYLNAAMLSWKQDNVKEVKFIYLYKINFELDNYKTILNNIKASSFNVLKTEYKEINTLYFYSFTKINEFLNELKNSEFISSCWL